MQSRWARTRERADRRLLRRTPSLSTALAARAPGSSELLGCERCGPTPPAAPRSAAAGCGARCTPLGGDHAFPPHLPDFVPALQRCRGPSAVRRRPLGLLVPPPTASCGPAPTSLSGVRLRPLQVVHKTVACGKYLIAPVDAASIWRALVLQVDLPRRTKKRKVRPHACAAARCHPCRNGSMGQARSRPRRPRARTAAPLSGSASAACAPECDGALPQWWRTVACSRGKGTPFAPRRQVVKLPTLHRAPSRGRPAACEPQRPHARARTKRAFVFASFLATGPEAVVALLSAARPVVAEEGRHGTARLLQRIDARHGTPDG